MRDTFQVRFTRPQHGWMELTVRAGTEEVTVRMSHVPDDSLGHLVGSLRALCEGGLPGRTTCNGEPQEHDLYLEPQPAAGQARLRIVRYEGRARSAGTGKEVFAFDGERHALCASFWRALRRLEADFPAPGSGDWTHPFPQRDVEALGTRLKREP